MTTARPVVNRLLGLFGVVCVVAVWEALTRSGLLPQSSFPPFTLMVQALLDLVTQERFWLSIRSTMATWALGMALTFVLAVAVGVPLGRSRVLYRAFHLPIEFLKPIPAVVFIPLAVLILGTGQSMKLLLVIYAGFWPMLFQVLAGIHSIDPVALDTARAYRLGRRRSFTHVVLPSTWPFIATGLRVTASIVLIVAIVAELVGGARGLGQDVFQAQVAGNRPVMYAYILVAGVLGVLVNAGFGRLERRTLAWHPSQGGQG